MKSNYNVGKIYQEMELHLIKSMKGNLSRHLKEEEKYGFKWSQWQAEKLKEIKRYQRQNSSIITSYGNLIDKEVSEMIKSQFKEGTKDAQKDFKAALKKGHEYDGKMNKSFFRIDDGKANNLIKSINNDLSTANTATLRMINDEYRQVIHKAATFASNGVMTEKQAYDMATKDFLARGLNSIEYSNGARVNIANYAKMAVRTANQRAYMQGQGEFRKKIGNSLIRISKHSTQCHLCSPWAGKVLIDDVYSGGTPDDGNYQLLSEAMKQGLYHPNCRCGMGTYYPELKDVYDKEKPIEDAPNTDKENYLNLQIQKFSRLEAGSLDKDNVENYKLKKVGTVNLKEKMVQYNERPYVVSLKGIDSDYQAVIEDALKNVATKYPLETQINVKTTTSAKRFGHASTGLDYAKVRNKDLYNLTYSNEIAFSKVLMKDEETSVIRHINSYKAKGSQLTDSLATVYHEYAHIIDFNYALKTTQGLGESINNIIGKYTKAELLNIRPKALDINNKILANGMSDKIWNEMKNQLTYGDEQKFVYLVKKEFGSYAITSRKEFLAEGFANMMTIKEDKSEFLKLFGNLFDKEFRRM